jgi:hypothetical protein
MRNYQMYVCDGDGDGACALALSFELQSLAFAVVFITAIG